jgi:hypothetical protein
VADGAISFVIDHFVTTRVSKHFYGTRCNSLYDDGNVEHIRRSSQTFISAAGEKRLPRVYSVILPRVCSPLLKV